MGKRLNKIVTRTGDDGTTGLGDGRRVRKDDARIAALGDIDELNSKIGFLLCEPLPDDVRAALTIVQHDLFDLGSELCIPGRAMMADAPLARLDQWLADWNATLPPLREFILPGGSRAAALAHVCRTVCRRAERAVVALAVPTAPGATRITRAAGTTTPPASAPHLAGRYMNRLSDLLFVLARVLNRADGGSDVLWRHERDAEKR